jgi:hypothetical protein
MAEIIFLSPQDYHGISCCHIQRLWVFVQHDTLRALVVEDSRLHSSQPARRECHEELAGLPGPGDHHHVESTCLEDQKEEADAIRVRVGRVRDAHSIQLQMR